MDISFLPVEQPDANLLFQRLDAAAECRLAQTYARSSSRKVLLFGKN